MKHKLTALLTALTLTLTASAASAHTFIGGHEKEIQKIVAAVEKKLGPLNEEVTFYNEKTKEDGYNRLVSLGVNPDIAKPLVQTSTGLTMPQAKDKWVVIIRENTESEFFLKFAICHEIIHRYQVNSYPIERIYDRNLIEGEANILAAKIMGVNIKSEENWQELKNFNEGKPYDPYSLILAQHHYAKEYCKTNNDMLFYKINNPKKSRNSLTTPQKENKNK